MPQKQLITASTDLTGFTAKQQATICEALAAKRTVEIETSLFSDPGSDYTKIIVDGECIMTIPGY